MTLKEFLIISDVASDKEAHQQAIKDVPKPFKVGKRSLPEDLNGITMGQLMQIQGIVTMDDLFTVPFSVLLSMTPADVMKSEAVEVLGFAMWVSKEVERINRLFATTSLPPTQEEIRAGIENMQIGPFGIIDYYALRMGITDHAEVENVPWTRVYKCLDIDAKKAQFQRRLQTILSNKK